MPECLKHSILYNSHIVHSQSISSPWERWFSPPYSVQANCASLWAPLLPWRRGARLAPMWLTLQEVLVRLRRLMGSDGRSVPTTSEDSSAGWCRFRCIVRLLVLHAGRLPSTPHVLHVAVTLSFSAKKSHTTVFLARDILVKQTKLIT